MPMTERAVRVALEEVCRVLAPQHARLQQLAAELPAFDEEERGHPRSATELRGLIECVLADRLTPALTILRQAARKGRQGQSGSPGGPRALAPASPTSAAPPVSGSPAAAGPVRVEARM